MIAAHGIFQSPPPMREATLFRIYGSAIADISIPASHAGGDMVEHYAAFRIGISIPASHAGGDAGDTFEYEFGLISIPASHAGGDPNCGEILGRHLNFNPRLPCGRRPCAPVECLRLQRFQSPPPMREATIYFLISIVSSINFNPRLPCGRRPGSVHSVFASRSYFNPRLPCGRRQRAHNQHLDLAFISIPASHAGGDDPQGRMQALGRISIPASHAGGDNVAASCVHDVTISIPASHAGGDPRAGTRRTARRNFNPRLPCGRRLQHIVLLTISLPDIVKSHSRKQKRAS